MVDQSCARSEAGLIDVDEESSNLVALIDLMARLRAECGWKAVQTHRTLARHLLEETYEALEVIESGQVDGEIDDEHLAEELGDVLLQVYFHAAIAAESGRFDIEDVAAGLREKLIRRNQHVFGEVVATDPAEINEHWERIKAGEKQRSDLFDGIPLTLPALARAAKVLDRLERAGRPVPDGSSDDLGDRLLALVAEARTEGIDPEQALRDAVRRLS
jgi:XTP/dITP diphosphohydrolase